MEDSEEEIITLARGLDKQKKPSHLCGFYKDSTERIRILAEYYREGFKRNELCIFVTDQEPFELVKDLGVYDLNIEDAINNRDFQMYKIKDTYILNGKFSATRMLENLKSFVNQAKSQGYSGVRGGGDMAWLVHKVPGWKSIGEYESKINQFIRFNNFTGICLFHSNLLHNNHELTPMVMQTHHSVADGEKIYNNPFYVEPERYPNESDSKVTPQIDGWLKGLPA